MDPDGVGKPQSPIAALYVILILKIQDQFVSYT